MCVDRDSDRGTTVVVFFFGFFLFLTFFSLPFYCFNNACRRRAKRSDVPKRCGYEFSPCIIKLVKIKKKNVRKKSELD